MKVPGHLWNDLSHGGIAWTPRRDEGLDEFNGKAKQSVLQHLIDLPIRVVPDMSVSLGDAGPGASSWNQVAAFIKARLRVRSIETYRSGVIPTSLGLTLSWRRPASTCGMTQ
jgi:hypothetical protein